MKKIIGYMKGGKSYLQHGEIIVEIPRQMVFKDTDGDYKLVDSLTELGNPTLRNGLKSVRFVSREDDEPIVDVSKKSINLDKKRKEQEEERRQKEIERKERERQKEEERKEKERKDEEEARKREFNFNKQSYLLMSDIKDAKNLSAQYKVFFDLMKYEPDFLNAQTMPKVYEWREKFYKKHKNDIFDQAKNNKNMIKEAEDGFIEKLTKAKKALLEKIEYNQRPTEKQFDNFKSIIVQFIAMKKEITRAIDQNDDDDNYEEFKRGIERMIDVKALDNIIKRISKYLAKFESNVKPSVEREYKPRKPREDKEEKEEKEEKEDVKQKVKEEKEEKKKENKKDDKGKKKEEIKEYTGPTTHRFMYRMKKPGETEEEFYEDLILKAYNFLNNMKRKRNITPAEEKTVDDLSYKLFFDVAPRVKQMYGWDVLPEGLEKPFMFKR